MSSVTGSHRELLIANDAIALRGDGTAYLPQFDALLVADLHLGKDASFRAAGIPVPEGMNLTTLENLSKSLEEKEARSLCLLGDLIHDGNSITESLISIFASWRQKHDSVSMTLIRGNHDRHVLDFPKSWNLDTTTTKEIGSFQLRHEVNDDSLQANELFQIGGHWHPVTFVGRGADRMRLPCFASGKRSLTLPAFGPFKGGMVQKRSNDQKLFPVCDGLVLGVA